MVSGRNVKTEKSKYLIFGVDDAGDDDDDDDKSR